MSLERLVWHAKRKTRHVLVAAYNLFRTKRRFRDLPNSLILIISGYVDLYDRAKLSGLCKRLRDICKSVPMTVPYHFRSLEAYFGPPASGFVACAPRMISFACSSPQRTKHLLSYTVDAPCRLERLDVETDIDDFKRCPDLLSRSRETLQVLKLAMMPFGTFDSNLKLTSSHPLLRDGYPQLREFHVILLRVSCRKLATLFGENKGIRKLSIGMHLGSEWDGQVSKWFPVDSFPKLESLHVALDVVTKIIDDDADLLESKESERIASNLTCGWIESLEPLNKTLTELILGVGRFGVRLNGPHGTSLVMSLGRLTNLHVLELPNPVAWRDGYATTLTEYLVAILARHPHLRTLRIPLVGDERALDMDVFLKESRNDAPYLQTLLLACDPCDTVVHQTSPRLSTSTAKALVSWLEGHCHYFPHDRKDILAWLPCEIEITPDFGGLDTLSYLVKRYGVISDRHYHQRVLQIIVKESKWHSVADLDEFPDLLGLETKGDSKRKPRPRPRTRPREEMDPRCCIQARDLVKILFPDTDPPLRWAAIYIQDMDCVLTSDFASLVDFALCPRWKLTGPTYLETSQLLRHALETKCSSLELTVADNNDPDESGRIASWGLQELVICNVRELVLDIRGQVFNRPAELAAFIRGLAKWKCERAIIKVRVTTVVEATVRSRSGHLLWASFNEMWHWTPRVATVKHGQDNTDVREIEIACVTGEDKAFLLHHNCHVLSLVQWGFDLSLDDLE